MAKDVPIKLNSFFYTKLLAIIALTFVCLHILIQTGYFNNWGFIFTKMKFWFSLDSEGNFPTFFSTLILLNASILLFVISYIESSYVKSKYTKNWFLLAFGFLYLAIDEIIGIHERLNEPVKSMFKLGSSKLFMFSWIIAGLVIVFVLALIFFRFIFSLPLRFRKLFILSAFLYVGGAIILEFASGAYLGFANNKMDLLYFILTALEEGAEMSGVILFIYSLLEYIKTQYNLVITI